MRITFFLMCFVLGVAFWSYATQVEIADKTVISGIGISGKYSGLDVDWAPDSSELAVASENDGLYLVSPDGANLNQIVSSRSTKCNLFDSPAYSPDGATIVFMCTEVIAVTAGY